AAALPSTARVSADVLPASAAAGVLLPWPEAALPRVSDILLPAQQCAKRDPDWERLSEKSTVLSMARSVFAVVPSCFCPTRIDIQQNVYNTVDLVVESAIWHDFIQLPSVFVIFILV